MKKKIIGCILIISTLIVINIIIFYPRSLIGIIGREPNIDSNTHLEVTYRNSILGDGTTVESYSQSDSKKILEYLKSHKYMVTNVSYRKLDNLDYYIIVMKNNGKEVLRATTRGDGFLSIMDKNGKWVLYRVVGNKFDLEFLKDFNKSFSKKVNDTN